MEVPHRTESPYRLGPHKFGYQTFVGREDLINHVYSMLCSRDENAILIEGQRRVGKTWLLSEIQQRLGLQSRSILFSFGEHVTDRGIAQVLAALYADVSEGRRRTPAPPPRRRPSAEAVLAGLIGLLNRTAQTQAGFPPFTLLLDEVDALGSSAVRPDAENPYTCLSELVNKCPETKFAFVRSFDAHPGRQQADLLFKDMRCLVVGFLSRSQVGQACRLSAITAIPRTAVVGRSDRARV